MADPTGTTITTYTVRNEVEAVAVPSGKTVTYSYDPAGRREWMAAYGEGIFTYGYDDAGRQTAVIQRDVVVWDPVAQAYQVLDLKTQYKHDNLGRVTRTIFHDDSFIEVDYDALGRRIAERDQNQIAESPVYLAARRPRRYIGSLWKPLTPLLQKPLSPRLVGSAAPSGESSWR